jgi:Fe-S-cluster-containing dehydrogenase component
MDYKSSMCDLCVNRADDDHPPLCVTSCKQKAIEWKEVEEDKTKNIFVINDRLAVFALSFNERRPIPFGSVPFSGAVPLEDKKK